MSTNLFLAMPAAASFKVCTLIQPTVGGATRGGKFVAWTPMLSVLKEAKRKARLEQRRAKRLLSSNHEEKEEIKTHDIKSYK